MSVPEKCFVGYPVGGPKAKDRSFAVKDRRLGTDRRRSHQRTVVVSEVSYATVYLVRHALAGGGPPTEIIVRCSGPGPELKSVEFSGGPSIDILRLIFFDFFSRISLVRCTFWERD